MIGYPELIVILVLALFLFGADKLPELARSLGKSAKEFKKAQMQVENELTGEEKPLDDKDSKIYKLATDMGIDIKGKTSEQLTEEVRIKMSLRADK